MIVSANSPQAIEAAVEVLRHGGLVAMPTETVYGLAADASQVAAVAQIYLRKQRPANNPLIVHLADVAQLSDWAINIPAVAYRIANHVWPGPVTLVLQKAAWVPEIVTAGQASIALRIPSHPVALSLLQAFGGGLAAPSANRFTRLSPTTAQHVEQGLGKDLMILDGGAANVGIESTIVDCTGERLTILRPGMLGAAALSEIVGYSVQYHTASEIQRPGSHWLHYTPQAECCLMTSAALLQQQKCDLAETGFVVYSPSVAQALGSTRLIQLSSEPAAYARELYAALHVLDAAVCRRIVVELVPDAPDWYAVRERLNKAVGAPCGVSFIQ